MGSLIFLRALLAISRTVTGMAPGTFTPATITPALAQGSSYRKHGIILSTLIVILLIFQSSPYTQVSPGPVVNVSQVLLESSENIDPTFGHFGTWHVTTINATSTRWYDVAACFFPLADCTLYEVSTSPAGTEQVAMENSIALAARNAGPWTSGDHFTPNFEVDLGNIGGASGGLILSLAFIDAASPGDLTAGLHIAGTGTIDILGNVGRVGGVPFKVQGAIAAGADVFFVPLILAEDARLAAGDQITVVPVQTVTDALTYLCQRNSTPPLLCANPALRY